MQFSTITSPYTNRPNSITMAMLWVILALIPGTIGMIWLFGWGILINIVLAVITAIACDAIAMKLRKRPAMPAISDLSAILTALLFALAVPPLGSCLCNPGSETDLWWARLQYIQPSYGRLCPATGLLSGTDDLLATAAYAE